MVFEELDNRWERAASRGIAPRRYAESTGAGFSVVCRYVVDSGTRDGLRRSVRLTVSANGVRLDRTCESGMAGGICWHATAVLMAEGWIPEGPERAVA